MMTREENICQSCAHSKVCKFNDGESSEYCNQHLAISALRPVSREAWTAKWTVDEVGHKCSKCGEYLPDGEDVRKPQFCPECGRAMTDEAVDMVMERINKMEETEMLEGMK